MAFTFPPIVLLCCIAFSPLYMVLIRFIRQRSLWSIPGPPSSSLLSGNLRSWFGYDAIPYREKVMDEYGRIIRLTGLLGEQMISIADTKALYEVLIKRQDVFEESEGFREQLRFAFGGLGLLSAIGDAHRKQRKLMNPAFSINHMRRMIPVFQAASAEVQTVIRAEVGQNVKEIDVMEYVGRLALELISRAGLGHTFRAIEGEDQEYSLAVKKLIPLGGNFLAWRAIIPFITRTLPSHMIRSIARRIPWPVLHQWMDVTQELQSTSRRIWEEKKRLFALGDKSVVNEHGEGKDIMSILLKSNLAASESEKLTDDELLAQITTFTIAGSDTTSNALARILQLLSLHPSVQDKLREELGHLDLVEGTLGYNELAELPYLEAVCRETLRLFPPLHFVQREAKRDYVLPLALPFIDVHGKSTDTLFIPAGTSIYVDIVGVNRDTAIWGADAKEWRPERWLTELPQSVADARIPGVYSNTLTFIGGSRACIGFKFAELEMKVVLAHLVSSFRFEPALKQEIKWRFGGILTPSVKGSKTHKPELPLRVSAIN